MAFVTHQRQGLEGRIAAKPSTPFVTLASYHAMLKRHGQKLRPKVSLPKSGGTLFKKKPHPAVAGIFQSK